jgi:hypothetical protein
VAWLDGPMGERDCSCLGFYIGCLARPLLGARKKEHNFAPNIPQSAPQPSSALGNRPMKVTFRPMRAWVASRPSFGAAASGEWHRCVLGLCSRTCVARHCTTVWGTCLVYCTADGGGRFASSECTHCHVPSRELAVWRAGSTACSGSGCKSFRLCLRITFGSFAQSSMPQQLDLLARQQHNSTCGIHAHTLLLPAACDHRAGACQAEVSSQLADVCGQGEATRAWGSRSRSREIECCTTPAVRGLADVRTCV